MSDTIKRVDALNTLLRMEGTKIDKALAMGEIRSIPSTDRPQEWIPCSKKLECEFCLNHEQGDTLYEPSDWDGGIGFDYIRNIKYCPLCGTMLKGADDE